MSRPFVLELAAAAFDSVGWFERWPFGEIDPFDVDPLLAEHGRDADAYAPPWCGFPADETLTPLPLVLWGVLWPSDPRGLVTARGRAFVKSVVAARDGIAEQPRWSAPALDLAIKVLATVRSFERLLRSEADEAARQRRREE